MRCFTFSLYSVFLPLLWAFVNGKKVDNVLMEQVKKTLGNLRNDFEECIKKSRGIKKKTVDEDAPSKDGKDEMDPEKDSENEEDPDCPVPKEENEDWCCVEPVNTHTMCKFDGISAECSDSVIWSGLSMVGKSTLVDKHNELRNFLANGNEAANLGEGNQPKAANMKKLVWSEELSQVAQRWADQCFFDHDFNRNNKDGGKVGQNAYNAGKYRFLPARIKRSHHQNSGGNKNLSSYQIEMTKQNYRFKRSNLEVELSEEGRMRMEGELGEAVQSWYTEVSDPGFHSKHIQPFKFNAGTGHYTQVVWADTEMVGCGWVLYETFVDDGVQFYNSLVVCNYFPSGNYVGSAMYIQGEPASQCPQGYSPGSQYEALCQTFY